MMKRLSALFGSRKVGSTSVLPKRAWHCIQFALLFILTFMVISLSYAQSSKKAILERSDNSITFSVDGKLSSPKVGKMPMDNERIISEFLEGNRLQGSRTIIKSSFDGESVYYEGSDVFFHFMVDAYANHRSVVFTPDDIWMLISQAFARHVNDNAEALRDKIVNHDKKITLNVQTGIDLYSPDADWNSIFRTFEEKIAENTKADIAKLMVADFSTTGTVERIASEITLMNATKAYFNFLVTYMGCGIPSVTLTGTPQDWQSILERVKEFRRYGLDWWADDLEPILTEFVKASKGKPDTRFWQSIVKKYRPGEMRGAACGFDESTELDGWFLKFFPYDRNGRLPEKVRITHEMLPEQVTTQFKYVILDAEGSGQVLSEMQMELCAGIVGISFDEDDWTSTPKIGWFVRLSQSEEEILEKMYEKDRRGDLSLRVDRVPDVLRHAAHIKTLKLTFVGKVNLPEWLEKKDIDHLVITNELSAEEQASLRERFPNIQFSRW